MPVQVVQKCDHSDRAQIDEIFDLSACRLSSSTDQILSSSASSFATKRVRNLSMDALNDTTKDESPKRNSIVSEIVAM